MEVLRLCNIIVVPKAPPNLLGNVKLAIENLCGQKRVMTSRAFTKKSFQFKKVFESERKAYVTYLA